MPAWLTQLLQLLLVLAAAPWLTGLTRTLKSRLLRRRGPSPLQPYRDLWKLLRKETVVAEVNRNIIHQGQRDGCKLADGDQVELIQFVGGG